MRERGLKRVQGEFKTYLGKVAPRAGAWIEARLVCRNFYAQQSLPVRERGLKPMLMRPR